MCAKVADVRKTDIDGDGDIWNIIAGNFAQSPGAITEELIKKWKSTKYEATF